MRALFCKQCRSLFSLDFAEKSCFCGETKGVYDEDGMGASYVGDHAIPIGIDNTTFDIALRQQSDDIDMWKFDGVVMGKKDKMFEKVNRLEYS